jgi:putative transcriptional regulator
MENCLKELRADRNLSQEALAKLLGVSRQSVNSIERGKYDPSLPLVFKLSKVLKVSIEEIFFPD